MTETMMVQVTLVTATVDMTVHAGDKLMMLNGVCIGVNTEQRAKAVVATTMPRPTAVPAPKAAKAKPQVRSRRDEAEHQAALDVIMRLVREKPGITTSELADAAGYARDAPDRWRVRDDLKHLVRHGLLRAKAVSANPKQGQRYWTAGDATG